MRRLLLPGGAAALVMLAAVATLPADTAEAQQLPEHPHILLLHIEVNPEIGAHGALVGFKRCVDLAGNRALRLNAHHGNMHFGQAGIALQRAGHAVAPTAPFPMVPWQDCATFEAFFDSIGGVLPLPPPSH